MGRRCRAQGGERKDGKNQGQGQPWRRKRSRRSTRPPRSRALPISSFLPAPRGRSVTPLGRRHVPVKSCRRGGKRASSRASSRRAPCVQAEILKVSALAWCIYTYRANIVLSVIISVVPLQVKATVKHLRSYMVALAVKK